MEFASLLNWSQLYKLTIAIHRTMELFRLPENGKMIHLNDVFQQDLDIWSESPDLPWTAERYKTKEDIKHDPEAVGRVRKFAFMVKNGDGLSVLDCLVFARSHICDEGEYKMATGLKNNQV